MSFVTGMAVGMALSSASAKGLTAGQLAASAAIGIPLGMAAGLGTAALVAKNPRAVNALRFGVGACLLAPVLAAEDIARKMGVPIAEKGVLYNDEGQSIWQIWNESAA